MAARRKKTTTTTRRTRKADGSPSVQRTLGRLESAVSNLEHVLGLHTANDERSFGAIMSQLEKMDGRLDELDVEARSRRTAAKWSVAAASTVVFIWETARAFGLT